MAQNPGETKMRGVLAEVTQRYPSVRNGGIVSCRKIAGSSRWSQHAWGNAVDLKVPDSTTGDRLYRWLIFNQLRLGIGVICWKDKGGCRAADHQTHIHVEGVPKFPGTPACAGGRISGGGVRTQNLDPFGNPFDPLGSLSDPLEAVADVAGAIGKLLDPNTYVRVLWFVLGAAAFGGGVVIFVKELSGVDLRESAKAIGVKFATKG